MSKYEVCKDLIHAGICSGWGGSSGPGCTLGVNGEAASTLQRRKDIRSGKKDGGSSEWLGYESLHDIRSEKGTGGNYYGCRIPTDCTELTHED